MNDLQLHSDAESLDAKSWSPFGWLPVPDTDPRDGESRLFFEWGDVHVNLIGHSADEVPTPSAASSARCSFTT